MERDESLTEMVIKRTKEKCRIKAGKASETPAPPKSSIGNEMETENGETPEINPLSERGYMSQISERDPLEGGSDVPSITMLLGKISKMEDSARKERKENAEIMSNLAQSIIKMQDQQQNLIGEEESIVDEQEMDVNVVTVDNVFDDENESEIGDDDLFSELENRYAEKKVYGLEVHANVGALVTSAITKPVPDEELKTIENNYLIPENCKTIGVPQINKELWEAFRPNRDADLAVQAVQKFTSMAMVVNLRILDIIKAKGDMSRLPNLIKDQFSILAQGIYVANRKRKLLIRPSLPTKYKKACELEEPVTSLLFGDNLDDKVDQIEKQEKRVSKLNPQNSFFTLKERLLREGPAQPRTWLPTTGIPGTGLCAAQPCKPGSKGSRPPKPRERGEKSKEESSILPPCKETEVNYDQSDDSETGVRTSGQNRINCTNMANTGVVFDVNSPNLRTIVHIAKQLSTTANSAPQKTPSQEFTIGCFRAIRKKLEDRGLSKDIVDLILQSWRKSTGQQYRVYFDKWMLFSDKKQVDTFNPPINSILEFLSELYTRNLSYSAINTAKSAISSVCSMISGIDIGNEVLIKRFMKGIFTNRPSLPKYKLTWDVNVVFDYILSMETNEQLTLLQLTEKIAILLMLLSGQRAQTIHVLKLQDIHIQQNKIVCVISNLLKQSKPGKHLEPIEIESYPDNSKLCIVKTMTDYIARTSCFRGNEQQLFISTMPPHQGVTKSTISRWIKSIMGKSGIDINCFGAHSCRAASSSLAGEKGLPIDVIMKAAGWSSESTYKKHYNKAIKKHSYSATILNNVLDR